MFTIEAGKVFEGPVFFMDQSFSFRLTFNKVENNTFESTNGLFTENFGELVENSSATNGTITQLSENVLELKWSDGASEFQAEFNTNDGELAGGFTQTDGPGKGQTGTFKLA